MIDTKSIISVFNKSYPNLTVTLICDFNDKLYLIEAVEDLSKTDYNDPYYVMVKTGKQQVVPYPPMIDPDQFFAALDKPLYTRPE